jgi:hypothetical protein
MKIKSKILDMVYAMRSFGNINEKTKNGYRVCEVGFQHMTETLPMLPQNRWMKKGGDE